MAQTNPNIDVAVILSLIEATISAITGLTVEFLGSAPKQAGDSVSGNTMTARIKDLEMTFPQRRRDGISGDEAQISVVLSVAGPSDGDGGGLLALAKALNAIKLAFDRQDLIDGSSLITWRPNCTSLAIVDVADASGGDNADHGALAGSLRLEGFAQKTSGLDLAVPA